MNTNTKRNKLADLPEPEAATENKPVSSKKAKLLALIEKYKLVNPVKTAAKAKEFERQLAELD